jgi:hypothetical protein
MIQVPNNGPEVVAFVQKQVSKLEAGIANEQITKAARQEVDALSAVDNASFRLTKATEQMKAAEIAYHEAVAKGASNREQLRAIYNNTLAGYRDADKAAEIAADNLAVAKAATQGLRFVAKGAITSGDELKAAIKAASTDEEKAACVAAAGKLKLPFFLPKGWKAQYGSGAAAEAPSQPTTKSIQKDGSMKALLILCPQCMGHDTHECDNCGDDSMVSEENFLSHLIGDDQRQQAADSQSMEFGKAFTTDSLLTRDFQKSVAYQNYIFTKGGPGSGPEEGHPFRGNQWTGGVSTDSKGRAEGWKTKMGRYAKNVEEHTKAAQEHERVAREHSVAGRHAEAGAEFRRAAARHELAAGAHYGIHSGMKKYADHPDVKAGRRMPAGVETTKGVHYGKADEIRTREKAGMLYQADLHERRAAKAN